MQNVKCATSINHIKVELTKTQLDMLKNLLKIGVVACLLAATTTVSAQSEQEYPHYGFWSNWSIGIKADFDKQANAHGWVMGEGASIGGSIFLEKELNYVWDLDLRLGMPGLISNEDLTRGERFAKFGLATAGFKFSVNNALMGYNPERRGSFYLFANAGIALWHNYYTFDGKNPVNGEGVTDHRVNFMGEAGLGYSYDVCKHSSLFVEASLISIAHFQNIFRDNRAGLDVNFALGYAYNFGVTAADEELIAQRALLTQENLDALNNQVAQLERDLDNSRNNEKKLESRISQLENDLNNAKVNSGNNAAAAELQAKIDQIKADQLTFYALPFSIQYGVDQYTVNGNEMQKLKAIARVMQDNPNTTYAIYGFCDYTGSDAYNMKLSQKRAEEVKRLLVEKYGIAENRLSCEWKGKTMAFGDIQYSVNRRVSFYRVIE